MVMRDDGLVPAGGGERPAARPDRGAPGGSRPPARQAMRIGDAERDTAAANLGDHYAAGRLTLDELHDRIDLVLSARTRGQLGRAMRDLPSPRDKPRPLAAPPVASEPPLSDGRRQGSADASHDGRLAAIGLLLLAMLIWLFTVMMFARHGYYYHHPYYPDQPPHWHHP